jgi:hypothetical protein
MGWLPSSPNGIAICQGDGLILNFCDSVASFGSHQFWAGATVHCSLKHLEAVDLPFGLTVALREIDCIFYGINIAAQNEVRWKYANSRCCGAHIRSALQSRCS